MQIRPFKAAIILASMTMAAAIGYTKDNVDIKESYAPIREQIKESNRGLSTALKANATYTGTLLNAKPVKVEGYQQGIIGIVPGVIDTVFGTRVGVRHSPATELTVRLDNPRNRTQQIVSIIQGGDVNMKPGDPVFVVTTGTRKNLEVYVSLNQNPEVYNKPGVEEKAVGERAVRRAEQQNDVNMTRAEGREDIKDMRKERERQREASYKTVPAPNTQVKVEKVPERSVQRPSTSIEI